MHYFLFFDYTFLHDIFQTAKLQLDLSDWANEPSCSAENRIEGDLQKLVLHDSVQTTYNLSYNGNIESNKTIMQVHISPFL